MDDPLLWFDIKAQPVRRILVVDDDPDINRLLRVRLAARGYEVLPPQAVKRRWNSCQKHLPILCFSIFPCPASAVCTHWKKCVGADWIPPSL